MTARTQAGPRHVVLLAGRRSGEDSLAAAAGAPHRALLDIEGEPMLVRVARGLLDRESVERLFVSIDAPELLEAIPFIRDAVKEGDSIAAPLRRSGQFPPIVTHMIAIGEKSGQLEQMLGNVARSYEVQVDSVNGQFVSVAAVEIVVSATDITVAGVALGNNLLEIPVDPGTPPSGYLVSGVVRDSAGAETKYRISGGFLEVHQNHVVVLVQKIEPLVSA